MVAQACEFRSGWGARRSFDDIRLVLFLVPRHPIFQQGFVLGGAGAAEGAVGLVDLSIAEHRGQSFKGFGGLGENDAAAYGAVQTVGNAHKHGAGLSVALGDVGLEGFRQAFVSRLVALRDFSYLFIDNQQVIVFIQDVRHVFSLSPVRGSLLSRLQFETSEMSTLLDTSSSTVSNARKRIAAKLFHVESAADLDAKLLELQ